MSKKMDLATFIESTRRLINRKTGEDWTVVKENTTLVFSVERPSLLDGSLETIKLNKYIKYNYKTGAYRNLTAEAQLTLIDEVIADANNDQINTKNQAIRKNIFDANQGKIKPLMGTYDIHWVYQYGKNFVSASSDVEDQYEICVTMRKLVKGAAAVEKTLDDLAVAGAITKASLEAKSASRMIEGNPSPFDIQRDWDKEGHVPLSQRMVEVENVVLDLSPSIIQVS